MHFARHGDWCTRSAACRISSQPSCHRCPEARMPNRRHHDRADGRLWRRHYRPHHFAGCPESTRSHFRTAYRDAAWRRRLHGIFATTRRESGYGGVKGGAEVRTANMPFERPACGRRRCVAGREHIVRSAADHASAGACSGVTRTAAPEFVVLETSSPAMRIERVSSAPRADPVCFSSSPHLDADMPMMHFGSRKQGGGVAFE